MTSPADLLAAATVDPAVWALRPDYRALLVVVVEGLHPTPGDATSEGLLRRAEELARSALQEQPVDRLPHVAAWREAYRAFGARPGRTRNSLEALTRRGKGEGPATKLVVADLEMDLLSRGVKRAGQKVDLQPREFRLLEYLMRHAGQVVTRTMLLEGVWDYHFDPQTNVIDVHVSRLRQKVDKPFPTPLIHTVRNAGYMLRAEAP